MPTQAQTTKVLNKLKAYKKKYLIKKYAELDESGTRLMINSFLTEILGYTELDEVRTEYAIKGTYADYVIQVDRKKHFVVEVKAIQIDLSEKHIRQAIGYCANEGIDWVLLTNGRQFELYRVIFGKPITHKKVFSFDLTKDHAPKEMAELFVLLTKKSLSKKELEQFWVHFQALEPKKLCKYLYSKEVVRFLRRTLKKDAGLTFSEEDIFESIHQIIVTKIPSQKPKSPTEISKKKAKTTKKSDTKVPTNGIKDDAHQESNRNETNV